MKLGEELTVVRVAAPGLRVLVGFVLAVTSRGHVDGFF